MGWPARACIGGVVRTTGVERGGDVHEIRDSLDKLRRGKVRDASGRLAGLSEELQPRKLKGLAPAEAASLREELARIRVVLGWSAGDEE